MPLFARKPDGALDAPPAPAEPAPAPADPVVAAVEPDGADAPELYVPLGHFYSPMVDPEEARRDAARIWGRDPNDVPGVDLNLDGQRALLDQLDQFMPELPWGWEQVEGLRYWFNNQWFAVTNGVFAYLVLRHARPRRYIEVGSGFSSALALDVCERFWPGETSFTFIEPNPERLEGLLWDTDPERVTIHRCRVQDVELSVFDQLEAGDILFIDSAHVTKTGSDVNFLLFDVLPRLAAGVLVQVHDVFTGFEYPEPWVTEQGRSWNEAYLLRAFLQYNDSWEIFLWDAALVAAGVDIEKRFWPAVDGSAGSLWLRRTR